MKKSCKIILSVICISFILVLLGFGIRRMTDTSQATDSNQTINAGNTESKAGDSRPGNNADNTESEIKDNSPKINFDDAKIEREGVEVRFKDGRVWTIIADPSLFGDDFDWDNFDFEMTDGPE